MFISIQSWIPLRYIYFTTSTKYCSHWGLWITQTPTQKTTTVSRKSFCKLLASINQSFPPQPPPTVHRRGNIIPFPFHDPRVSTHPFHNALMQPNLEDENFLTTTASSKDLCSTLSPWLCARSLRPHLWHCGGVKVKLPQSAFLPYLPAGYSACACVVVWILLPAIHSSGASQSWLTLLYNGDFIVQTTARQGGLKIGKEPCR